MEKVITFIHNKVRETKKDNKPISMYLILLYLKISLKTECWLHVIEKSKVNTLMMSMLGKHQGIKKIIRYFEDAPFDVKKNEYFSTKKCLSKKQ